LSSSVKEPTRWVNTNLASAAIEPDVHTVGEKSFTLQSRIAACK
jgi:hypothetical protein